MQHETRQYGDTVECHKCGKQWDKSDTDVPECKTKQQESKK